MRDRELIIRRFARSYEHYNKLAVVQQEIAKRLADLLREYVKEPKNGFEIGSGTGFLTKWLVEYFPKCNWIANDIVSKSRNFLPPHVGFIEGDGEAIEIVENQCVVASASTVQWFNDMAEFVDRVHEKLANRGVIAISTFGNNNFREITETTGETLNYLTNSELEHCFEKFEILYSCQWQQKLIFNTPIEVLQHIRATGVNAISSVRWTNGRLRQFCEDYKKLYKVPTLTFNPIIIIARKNG